MSFRYPPRFLALVAGLCLGGATEGQCRERGSHALSIQPFAIPDGSGYAFDYEYQVIENLGIYGGYLHAEYDDEFQSMDVYTVRGIRRGTFYKDEETVEGPILGIRYRLPTPMAPLEGLHVLFGLNVGVWSKEEVEITPHPQTTSEDIMAFYTTVGIGTSIGPVDVAIGTDVGGVTGDDADGFASLFGRLSLVF